jgi:hypothetical protein
MEATYRNNLHNETSGMHHLSVYLMRFLWFNLTDMILGNFCKNIKTYKSLLA